MENTYIREEPYPIVKGQLLPCKRIALTKQKDSSYRAKG